MLSILWSILIIFSAHEFLDGVSGNGVLQRVTIESVRNSTSEASVPIPKSESLSGNFPSLNQVSLIASEGEIQSVCVQSGLWAIFNGENYSDVSSILYTSGSPDDRACTNDRLNGTVPNYKSIRHIGNRELRREGISFYVGPFFTGEELYFDGRRLNLNHRILARSFGFTGKDNWTVYDGTDFRGTRACLLSAYPGDSNETTYDAVVYNKDLNLTIGSIQRGCEDQEQNITSDDWIELEISETEKLLTDGDELRLPSIETRHFRYKISGDSNWTVFSGLNFNGNARCLNLAQALIGNGSGTLEENSRTKIQMGIGSVKRGCVVEEGNREQRLLDLPKILGKHPNKMNEDFLGFPTNKIFFTSFLIALGILIIMILLAMGTTLYFYSQTRNRTEI